MSVNRGGGGRFLAAAVASAALAAGGSVVASGPAQSAPPAGDCAAPADISGLAKGDQVTGLTVTGVNSPTAPVQFDGEVLGVLSDGIAPGLDMVMVRVDMPPAEAAEMPEVDGIWQGMSGSPVYDDNGDLIGAVAYGLAYGPSWVAGVTPFAEMDDYLDASSPVAPAKIQVSDTQARTIARNSSASRAQAQQGFRQLKMPVSITKLSQARLTQAKKHEGSHLFKGAWAAGGAGAGQADATDADLVAGGNLAAELSYGDITAAGVGTVTSVCDDRIVGFGHPMMFSGKTSLGLAPADALYIQGESLGAPFKLANIGSPVGTITDDHLTGITGSFGAVPDATDVTSTVTYGSRDRTGTSHSLDPSYNADVTFSQILANHDRVVDAIMAGSEQVTYEATGTDADGAPFAISFNDLYQSDYDISFEGIWDAADITYLLSSMEGVTVDDVNVVSDVSDDAATWRVTGVEQKRGGEWTKLSRRHPAKGARGEELKLRAVLTGADGTTTVPLSVTVPGKARRFAELQVEGGAWMWNRGLYRSNTPQDVADALAASTPNNAVQATLATYSRRSHTERSTTTGPQSHVVYGRKQFLVRIAR